MAAFVAASMLRCHEGFQLRMPSKSLRVATNRLRASDHHPALVVLVHRELVKVNLESFLRSHTQAATATPPFTKLGGKSTFSAQTIIDSIDSIARCLDVSNGWIGKVHGTWAARAPKLRAHGACAPGGSGLCAAWPHTASLRRGCWSSKAFVSVTKFSAATLKQ